MFLHSSLFPFVLVYITNIKGLLGLLLSLNIITVKLLICSGLLYYHLLLLLFLVCHNLSKRMGDQIYASEFSYRIQKEKYEEPIIALFQYIFLI